ncbi:MAG: FAD-dependent oxidoreductase [Pseudomonadota bacterium]
MANKPDFDAKQQAAAEAARERDLQIQLKKMMEGLSHDIHVYLFTASGGKDSYSEAARQVIRMFRQLTPKLKLREFGLDHDLAKQWGIDSGPTMVFEPDVFNIRWMGAPVGEEGRTFLELVLLLGKRESGLGKEAAQVIGRIDSPRKVRVFVSGSCPYCPQQAVNGIKAAIENPAQVSLEIVDIQVRQDLAGKYNAQSVPQAFANDTLIAMGAQPEELFAMSLLKLSQQSVFIPEIDAREVETDLVIVGGGPAGLTAAIYAERAGLKTAVVEKGVLGGQMALTPVVENYPGITHVGGKALVDIMVAHALEYCTIFQDEPVMDISAGPPFTVQTSRRRFIAKAVLLATGASHKTLDVPGETRLSGKGVSYCSTCDGPLFKGKHVILVGGGNSAVTEALHLAHIGVNVTLVHRRDTLRAQEVLAKTLLDNERITVRWNTEIREIQGKQAVEGVLLFNNKENTQEVLPADGVFMAIGYAPAVDLAGKLGVELTRDGFIKRDDRHRTSIPGIYSAGDVEGGYKQIVTAAGQGAEAAMSIFEDTINPYWKARAVQA